SVNRKQALKPQDIADWDWIGLKMRPNHKTLINKAGKAVEIAFEPKIIVDSVDAVSQLAIAGLGLATPPAFLVEEELHKGLL
ncbi:LysR substrate-binding domain-containing protein, partial [Rhizobium ruizarguesonis]